MSSDEQNDPTKQVDDSDHKIVEIPRPPAEKSGWRGVLSKVLPTKKAKDKPSPNIYPLF
jgi:hypothetical protein